LEGGYTTLLTAFKAIETDTPVLVLAGSGRAADFIAEAYEQDEIHRLSAASIPSVNSDERLVGYVG